MKVRESERFEKFWLPEALNEVADRGQLFRELDRGLQRIHDDPLAGSPDGFTSRSVVRRLELDYAQMSIEYRVDPDRLIVEVRAIGREDMMDRLAPGVPLATPEIEQKVQREASHLRTSRDPDLLARTANDARRERDAGLSAGEDAIAVGAARVLEEVAVAQGHMLERSLDTPSAASKEIDALMHDAPAGARLEARAVSEHARVRLGVRDQEWSVEQAIAAQPERLRTGLTKRLERSRDLERTRDLSGPGGGAPHLGL